jgi:hypothetical protein
MQMVDRVVIPLRVLLVLLFAGLVMGQFFSMPGQFAYMAQEEPDLAHLRWPLTIFAGLEIACVQVVVVCIWRLLTLVRADRIFSQEAFRWVDVILGAMVAAWLLLAAATAYFLSKADDPGTPILLLGMLLSGGVLILLMGVMRALLRQATTLRTDMEAVI